MKFQEIFLIICVWVKKHPIYTTTGSLISLAIIGLVTAVINHSKADILNTIYPEVIVKISTPKKEINKGERVLVDTVITNKSEKKINNGVLLFNYDNDHLVFDRAGKPIIVDEISGEKTIALAPVAFYARSPTESEVTVSAIFSAGGVNESSNTLEFKVFDANQNENAPHFVITDTARIKISGTWNIGLGADNGVMKIVQGEDDTISGSYHVDGSKWSDGTITGRNMSGVFQVCLFEKNRKNEKLRISGRIEINPGNASSVEIHGCAYDIVKNNGVVIDSQTAEGVDCHIKRDYVGWKGVSVSTFTASSLMK